MVLFAHLFDLRSFRHCFRATTAVHAVPIPATLGTSGAPTLMARSVQHVQSNAALLNNAQERTEDITRRNAVEEVGIKLGGLATDSKTMNAAVDPSVVKLPGRSSLSGEASTEALAQPVPKLRRLYNFNKELKPDISSMLPSAPVRSRRVDEDIARSSHDIFLRETPNLFPKASNRKLSRLPNFGKYVRSQSTRCDMSVRLVNLRQCLLNH